MTDERQILVVVADEVDRAAVARAASAIDADIVQLDNGAHAVAAAVEVPFDCIFVDHELGDMDARELVGALRNHGVRSPIVVLTDTDDHKLAEELMTSGATDTVARTQIDGPRLARRFRAAVRLAEAQAHAVSASDLLGAERRLLASVVEQMPAGLIAAQYPDGEILVQNEQVEQILGGGLSVDAPGAIARDAEGAPIAPADWPLARALYSGESVIDAEISLEREGDPERFISARAVPVDVDDERVGAVMIVQDVTSERRAKEKAERAARARKETLAIVSHDLRGPLSSIGIAAEELRDPDIDADERLHYLDAIVRAVRRADRLITELLDAEQSDEGTLEVTPHPITVATLLERARAEGEVEAEAAGVELVVGDVAPGKLLADRTRVEQVFANLIGNALRFTSEGGRVTLSAVREGDRVRCTVADTGAGIPAALVPHIFDRFYQARSKHRGSAGLGLSIARGIVLAHGGAMGVDSEEGVGATFWFTLPAA